MLDDPEGLRLNESEEKWGVVIDFAAGFSC
jgi:hypothetical protein